MAELEFNQPKVLIEQASKKKFKDVLNQTIGRLRKLALQNPKLTALATKNLPLNSLDIPRIASLLENLGKKK